MGIVKKEAELGSAEFHHKEVRIMSRDKASSETNEAGFRTVDENVGWGKTKMAMGAGGVVARAGPKSIGIVRMECMTSDELETRGLEITRASEKAPQGKIGEGAGCGLGKDWIGWVRL